jgi:SAM-dependent methyltransferase
LWTRALLWRRHNIQVIVGKEDDPRLPTGAVDAVLICNTYHEFHDPAPMLQHVFQSLRSGGRLVVVDRAPHATVAEHTHEIPLSVVESELRQQRFEIVSQDDHFIDRSGDDLWWLVIGRKP